MSAVVSLGNAYSSNDYLILFSAVGNVSKQLHKIVLAYFTILFKDCVLNKRTLDMRIVQAYPSMFGFKILIRLFRLFSTTKLTIVNYKLTNPFVGQFYKDLTITSVL